MQKRTPGVPEEENNSITLSTPSPVSGVQVTVRRNHKGSEQGWKGRVFKVYNTLRDWQKGTARPRSSRWSLTFLRVCVCVCVYSSRPLDCSKVGLI
jgi:hypothetical protein